MTDSLMSKKIAELTREEKLSLRKPLGLPGLPYPIISEEEVTTGMGDEARTTLHASLKGLESAVAPLVLHTDVMPVQRVNGVMFREMPVPCMLKVRQALIKALQPDNKNRLVAVIGDAALGKSHDARTVGAMVHPAGCAQVDCGGMNMRELFFRTVIDYGKGVKKLFDEKVEKGAVSEETLERLEAKFPGAVVRGENGRTAIDWAQIGKTDAQVELARTELPFLYEKEGITARKNAFGIKTVHGEIIENFLSGRLTFLDEANRCEKGTMDMFQTFMQFARGETDEVTIHNAMSAQGDDESPKSFTFRRDAVGPAWGIVLACNDKNDGDTVQEFSTSMTTRLDPIYVGDPDKADWAHRASQTWTGLPVTTLYSLHREAADADPVGFSRWLLDLRMLGLSQEEAQMVPEHQKFFLMSWQDTVQAAGQVADYYHGRLQMSDTNSRMFETLPGPVQEEVGVGGTRIHASFRKLIGDFQSAMQGSVQPAEKLTLNFDLSSVFQEFNMNALGRVVPGWYDFGLHMSRAMQKDIVNCTVGMPRTREALVALARETGVMKKTFQEAEASNAVRPLSDLMCYDPLRDFGGREKLERVRGVLMSVLRAIYPDLDAEADEQVIPLLALGRALKAYEGGGLGDMREFIVPNASIGEAELGPIGSAWAVKSYDEAPGNGDLADYRSLLAALALPGYAGSNHLKVWMDDYLYETMQENMAAAGSDEQRQAMQEACDSLVGKSMFGLNFGIVETAAEGGSAAHMYILQDTEQKKTAILGPGPVPEVLAQALAENNISYCVKGGAEAAGFLDAFLTAGAAARDKSLRRSSQSLDAMFSEKVNSQMIRAFCMAVDVRGQDGMRTIPAGMTPGRLLNENTGAPALFTSIVRPRKDEQRHG